MSLDDNKGLYSWGIVATVIAVGLLTTVIVLAILWTPKISPTPNPPSPPTPTPPNPPAPTSGPYQCSSVTNANGTSGSDTTLLTNGSRGQGSQKQRLKIKTNSGQIVTANTQYRQCQNLGHPVPGGFQTEAECQAQCSAILPTSTATGLYYIQVGKQGDSNFGFLEPRVGSDGQYYLNLVQQIQVQEHYHGWILLHKNLWLGVTGIPNPNSPDSGVIMIPTALETQNATAQGWVLTNDNQGQIFYYKGANGQNCITLQSQPGYGYILGPCFPGNSSSAAASGFSFVVGGSYGCAPIS